ncbi:hypothetical protein PsorP6_006349 [Peronosclerospora sorghi]|uniref:Uncharacterized protein n=1 Tax=Peronosclerospora sorghi TaxID=230839 RepID=A0ACC0W7A0_9STRA|nr:hypothetical protein PsorP6_006349 [Peronosclerospora sorghi]
MGGRHIGVSWIFLNVYARCHKNPIIYLFLLRGLRRCLVLGTIDHSYGPTQSQLYCPASSSKCLWYQNTAPMTSSCTAQFSSNATNLIAAIWGSDSTGKYIQLIQNPTITKGGGSAMAKIRTMFNDDSALCAKAGGHDPATDFPIFISLCLVQEGKKKNDASESFTVKKIQIFTKN